MLKRDKEEKSLKEYLIGDSNPYSIAIAIAFIVWISL